MDAASTAFNKILHPGARKEDESLSPGSSGDQQAASVDKDTAPAVEHETIHKRHEQREQKVVDRERHQDHYKTTVQPLKEREVMPERHVHEQADVRHKHVDNDREHDAKVMLERKQGRFQDTQQEREARVETTKEPTVTSERTHHHLHETIQPVVEKETVIPSVTHKKIPIKETIQDPSLDEGITINEAMSKEEFEARLRK
ncbi:hypothetical protein F5X97DRAFT_295387 [Nemania serpens]|nr:hypothetical protein F5X97DRAFT_295387 [Nemania serpens]